MSTRIFASPLAKRLAAERGVDLSALKGSGPYGRIVRADLDQPLDATSKVVVPLRPSNEPSTKKFADLLGQSYREEATSSIRKVIAKRLTQAKQQVPHFYLTIECNIDALMQLRKELNTLHDAKISVNDFIIRASALALKKVPAANASWNEDSILYYDQADLSIAVATDQGLITPIIKKAETKGILALSNEMKELAIRARAGKLKPEEFQGGSFSISNLGMFGIKEFSAIINPPQACILAVGAGEERAIVKNGQISVATMMNCTLSVDHRVVDGAVGAQFLATFKQLIEQPLSLMS